MKKNYIREDFYKKILQKLPLCCVDLVVKNKKRFLLVKRKEAPAKEKWCFIGGRLLLNESLASAAKRKLKEELGVKRNKDLKFLGVGETKFKIGRFNDPIHSVNMVFLAEISDWQAENINLDLVHHFSYRWFERIPKGSLPYIKKFLKLSGFK